MLEIDEDAITPFEYLKVNGSISEPYRYTPRTPFGGLNISVNQFVHRNPWNTYYSPENPQLTPPYTPLPESSFYDRQIAMVARWEVNQES